MAEQKVEAVSVATLGDEEIESSIEEQGAAKRGVCLLGQNSEQEQLLIKN